MGQLLKAMVRASTRGLDGALAGVGEALGPDRLAQARELLAQGRSQASLEAAEAVLLEHPADVRALLFRAERLAERALLPGAGPRVKAVAVGAYELAAEHGADPEFVRYALAALRGSQAPSAAPSDYVSRLFDTYAERFDEHLVGVLDYRTPELLTKAALRAAGAAPLDVLDLGCGTGLCGPFLRKHAATLVGVDLSANMLEKCRERGGYDRLVCAEAVGFLQDHAGAFDLIVAADVLVYLGDLDALFRAARAALRPPGVLAFSVEEAPAAPVATVAAAADAPGFVLRPTMRYAHRSAYVRALAAAHGLDVVTEEGAVLRQDAAGPVDGLLFVLRRP